MRASELETLRRDLGGIVGLRHVTQTAAHREPYARDLWAKTQMRVRAGEPLLPPDAVVWPATTDEVSRIVRYARERQIPITPYGGGTSTVGGAMSLRAGITLDLKRMHHVLLIDAGGRRVRAQAGVMGRRLEQSLNQAGLTLGHHPEGIQGATLGGWIATRSAGQCSSHYGQIEDMVRGLTAVTGTGEVVQVGPERVPGTDLVPVLCGSEGSLAIVTEATLSVHPKPTFRAMRGFQFKGLVAGARAMRAVMRAGLRPHVMRAHDPLESFLVGADETKASDEGVPAPLRPVLRGLRQRSVGVALAAPGLLNRTAELLPERSLLVLSFEGDSQAACDADLRAAVEILRESGGMDLGERPARRWYDHRFSGGFRQSGIFLGHGWIDTAAVATTWDRVIPVYESVLEAVHSDAFVLCRLGHAYLEGCSIEFTMIGSAQSLERGEAGYDAAWRALLRAASESGATIAHHHGIGPAKARHLTDELGDPGLRLLRALKASFDPDGILNPGKILG